MKKLLSALVASAQRKLAEYRTYRKWVKYAHSTDNYYQLWDLYGRLPATNRRTREKVLHRVIDLSIRDKVWYEFDLSWLDAVCNTARRGSSAWERANTIRDNVRSLESILNRFAGRNN